MSKREAKESIVKPYEFGNTVKFSNDAVRAIEGIFNEYLLVLSSELSLQLRTTVRVGIEDMYEDTYGEFINSLDRVTMLGVYNYLPIENPLFINVPPLFGFLLVDNLCGGSINYAQKQREITNLDKKLVANFLTILLEKMERHWVNILSYARMGFMTIETSPLFYHTIPESDSVLIVDVAITINNKKYIIQYAYPYSTIGDKLSDYVNRRHKEIDVRSNTEEQKKAIGKNISNAVMQVDAVLGTLKTNLLAVNQLEVGDILIFQEPIHTPTTLLVQGVPQFKVTKGIQEENYAVSVVEKITKEEN